MNHKAGNKSTDGKKCVVLRQEDIDKFRDHETLKFVFEKVRQGDILEIYCDGPLGLNGPCVSGIVHRKKGKPVPCSNIPTELLGETAPWTFI